MQIHSSIRTGAMKPAPKKEIPSSIRTPNVENTAMAGQQKRCDDQDNTAQVQPDRSPRSRRRFVASVAGGGAVAPAIVGMIVAGVFRPAAVAQEPGVSTPAPPVFKSKYAAEQIAAAKKHDLYATFYGAQLIVTGKVGKREAPVPELPGAENRPPVFECFLYEPRTLYVNKQFAQTYEEHSIGGAPNADLDKTPYILAQTFGESQTYLGHASKDVLQVASIAIEQRTHDEAVRLHQAKTDPSSHPLFKAVRAARNIATVDVMDGMAASTAFDRAGNMIEELGRRIDKETHIVLLNANLRGKLPEDADVGSHLRITKPLASPVESQPLLVLWEMRKGRAQATHVETMDEATLRIAAAALKRDFERFTTDALGPQEGSSRGSEDVAPPDDHHHGVDPEAGVQGADDGGNRRGE